LALRAHHSLVLRVNTTFIHSVSRNRACGSSWRETEIISLGTWSTSSCMVRVPLIVIFPYLRIVGTLSSQEVSLDAPMQPQQLFFTPAGLIGVIIDLADDLALDLTGLQRNLSNYIQKQNGPDHTKCAMSGCL
jgi:hypothetical protein